jgi:hypothetical protein
LKFGRKWILLRAHLRRDVPERDRWAGPGSSSWLSLISEAFTPYSILARHKPKIIFLLPNFSSSHAFSGLLPPLCLSLHGFARPYRLFSTACRLFLQTAGAAAKRFYGIADETKWLAASLLSQMGQRYVFCDRASSKHAPNAHAERVPGWT